MKKPATWDLCYGKLLVPSEAVPKECVRHMLKLEGQVYHASWSKRCNEEPQMLNVEL